MGVPTEISIRIPRLLGGRLVSTLIREVSRLPETSWCERGVQRCEPAGIREERVETRLRGSPLVAVVYAADLRNGDHTASRRRRDWAGNGCNEECLARLIPFGERHFRRAVTEFVAHYHRERNHQGMNNELIEGPPAQKCGRRVHRSQRLGGLLNYYARAA
jgi:hypothetical protein